MNECKELGKSGDELALMSWCSRLQGVIVVPGGDAAAPQDGDVANLHFAAISIRQVWCVYA